jgi:cobyrinic acid a,c-diamide synthase
MPIPALILAGTHSGAGKTTVTLAILAALARRGLRVQGFKVGPDFIDPGHHTALTGRASRNLDTWLLDRQALAHTFRKGAEGADVAIVEGVMGLFDGRGACDEAGSTADLARAWNLPVVLVVDASGLARSIAPLVRGFVDFDERVGVVGVIANRVGSARHYTEYLAPAVRADAKVEALGYLQRNDRLAIPSRHLGLWTAAEFRAEVGFRTELADAAEATLDLDRLIAVARIPELPLPGPRPAPPAARRVRVAVARDSAFCFYYEDNLDCLRDAGAELIEFSPLDDGALPADTEVVYLGGGYPECHAARLSANTAMRTAIQRFHRQGGAIFAECGGMMACCAELRDLSGSSHPMWGLIPARVVMQPRFAALGYVTMETDRDTHLGPAGTQVRGHEFHFSTLDPTATIPYATRLLRPDRDPKPDGIQIGSLLAGYAHLHFGSNPAAAFRLVQGSLRLQHKGSLRK